MKKLKHCAKMNCSNTAPVCDVSCKQLQSIADCYNSVVVSDWLVMSMAVSHDPFSI